MRAMLFQSFLPGGSRGSRCVFANLDAADFRAGRRGHMSGVDAPVDYGVVVAHGVIVDDR